MDDKPLWDPNRKDQILRAPRAPSSTIANSSGERSSYTSTSFIPPEKSTLNVSAAEFIPRCYYDNTNTVMSKPSQLSIQNRLKIYKEELPSVQSSRDVQIGPRCGFQGDNNSHYTNNPGDDLRLRHIINTLILDPGQFHSLSEIFRQTLIPYFEDITTLAHITDLLISQAISNPGFTYTAARLCYSIEQESPAFRAQLHLTCEREFTTNPNKPGIVLFIAELYTQLHHENIYGRFLLTAFKQLLRDGGDNNIKGVCQALKLTGSALELYDKEALDEIMEILNDSRQYASGTALCLVDIVLKLRNSRWGYNLPNTQAYCGSEQDANWEDETPTVFYNPDGNTFSNEESAFLAAGLQSIDECLMPSLAVDDPDELYDPEPEMDEEIQAAFKEFVEFSRR